MGSWRFPEPAIRHSRVEFLAAGYVSARSVCLNVLIIGFRAMRPCKPCQVRKEAAVAGKRVCRGVAWFEQDEI